MANDFYNLNIRKFNPANVHVAVDNAAAGENSSGGAQTLEEQTKALFAEDERKKKLSHIRLNALDSTILEDEAYQNIDDELFKTEYKINKLEGKINALNAEIAQAKEIKDYQKADILIMRRRSLQAQLNKLNESYEKEGVSTKLSGELTNILTGKPKILTKIFDSCTNFMSNKLLPKISKTFKSGKTIKSALNKLETINKNVDEIVTTQAPYGESEERYEMLSDYLNSANMIHYSISKSIGTPTFFDTISSIDKTKIKDLIKDGSNFGKMTGSVTQQGSP